MEIGTLHKDQERKSIKITVHARYINAEPGSGGAADNDPNRHDDDDELGVMQGDVKAAVTKRLEEPNLLAFEGDNPAERQIDQKRCHQEKNRRQGTTHP